MKEHGKNYKRRVGKLAKDYREQIIKFASDNQSSWLQPVAVLFATGCRPEELAKGVKVSFDFERDEFVFTIQGAKVNDALKRGIEVREVRRKITNEHVMLALMQVVATGNEVKIESKKGFGNSITKASKKLFPRRKEQASPYSFRHSLATDLKSAGIDSVVIAAVMGHQSTASQHSYGRKRRGGSGGISPDEIGASTSQAIRKVSPLARFKKRVKTVEVSTQAPAIKPRGMSL